MKWTTATESNNSHFHIQRSWNGQDFQQMGRLPGKGTQQTISTYTFVDTEVNRHGYPTAYYRIAQVDVDGVTTYSTTEALQLRSSGFSVKAYPSLFQETLHIDIDQESQKAFQLTIIDPQGKLMWQKPVTQKTERFHVQTGSWASGVYFLVFPE